jgi:hypothetical protein
MRPEFLISVCTARPEMQGYFLHKFSTSVVRLTRGLTGDCFVGHNGLILGAVDGLYVLQGMENSLEVLLIVRQVL